MIRQGKQERGPDNLCLNILLVLKALVEKLQWSNNKTRGIKHSAGFVITSLIQLVPKMMKSHKFQGLKVRLKGSMITSLIKRTQIVIMGG